MHENANITYQTKIVKDLLDTLIISQPRFINSAKGSMKPEDIVSQMATKLLSEIPEKLNIKKIEES